MFIFTVFLLIFVKYSTQIPSVTESQLKVFRDDAEKRMRTALGEQVISTVLNSPLKKLAELETAGKEDLEKIAALQAPGDKEDAKNQSVQFWEDKMEEAIQPYITDPKALQRWAHSIAHPELPATMFIFLVIIFAFVTYSIKAPSLVDNRIKYYRDDAEKRMRIALGEQVSSNVLDSPLKKLSELEAAGKEDLEKIAAFEGPGDKEEAKWMSLQFWKHKMEEVIQPYITNPQSSQEQLLDHSQPSNDPTCNNSDQYQKMEKVLNEMSEEAFRVMREELKSHAVPAERVEDVTQSTWKALEGKRALDNAVFSITLSRQFAKNSAAGGEPPEEYMGRLKAVIKDSSQEFHDRINEIYK